MLLLRVAVCFAAVVAGIADLSLVLRAEPDVVFAGTEVTCSLQAGVLRCWGNGSKGQLGQGNTNNIGDMADQMGENLPNIDLLMDVKSVDPGDEAVCAVSTAGVLKCWGNSVLLGQGKGEINVGDKPDQMGASLVPVDLGGSLKAKQVSTGTGHVCAVMETGEAKCWGKGPNGELGQGNTESIGIEAGQMGDNLAPIELGQPALHICAGFDHTCALLEDKSVKCWGGNRHGQLGLGDNVTRGALTYEMGANLSAVDLGTGVVERIACGHGFSTCAVFQDKTVKCWGENAFGQLGQNDTENRGDDAAEMGEALPPINLGQTRTVADIAVGDGHVCALLDNADVKCWGANFFGQLGLGNAASSNSPGAEVVNLGSSGLPVTKISSHGLHTCATWTGCTKCWGQGKGGKLGSGSTSAVGTDAAHMGEALLCLDLTPFNPPSPTTLSPTPEPADNMIRNIIIVLVVILLLGGVGCWASQSEEVPADAEEMTEEAPAEEAAPAEEE